MEIKVTDGASSCSYTVERFEHGEWADMGPPFASIDTQVAKMRCEQAKGFDARIRQTKTEITYLEYKQEPWEEAYDDCEFQIAEEEEE